jgi:hypothetical protein
VTEYLEAMVVLLPVSMYVSITWAFRERLRIFLHHRLVDVAEPRNL